MTAFGRIGHERDHGSITSHAPGEAPDRPRAEMAAAWEAEQDHEDDPSYPSGAALGYAVVVALTALVAGPLGFIVGRWWQ